MKRIYSLLALLICSAITFGQTANIIKEFKELSLHYAKLDAFSMDVSVQYFDQQGKSVMVQKGHVVHSQNLHYIQMAGNKTLIKDNTYISVNDEQKTVVFNLQEKTKKDKTPNENIDISAMLDSLWENQMNIDYKIIQSKKGTLRVFISDSKNEIFDSYEMTIDTKKNQLLELVYYFKQTKDKQYLNQIKINYTNENNKPKFNQNILKVNHYVLRKKSQYVLSQNFENYQLIDQTKHVVGYE